MKKVGFGITFIQWIKILLKGQVSCIINAGKTSQSFKLERRTKQENLFLAYLFIPSFEIAFLRLKQNKNIKGVELFKKEFLFTGLKTNKPKS